MLAVRADDQPGAFAELRPGPLAAPNPRHPVFIPGECLNGDVLPDLGSSLAGRFDQERVQHGAPRAVERVCTVVAGKPPLQRCVLEVEPDLGRCRCAGGAKSFEQTPSPQARDTGDLDGVRRQRVTREPGPVDDEHPQSGASEQHSRRRAGGTRSDDDDVVWPKCHRTCLA